jgi:hypothetical protein
MVWWWTLYNEAVLHVHNTHPHVVHGWYAVETSDACHVAAAAGLLDTASAIDPQAHALASASCGAADPARLVGARTTARANQRNKGQVRLSLADVLPPSTLHGAAERVEREDVGETATAELEGRLRALATTLGYEL